MVYSLLIKIEDIKTMQQQILYSYMINIIVDNMDLNWIR